MNRHVFAHIRMSIQNEQKKARIVWFDNLAGRSSKLQSNIILMTCGIDRSFSISFIFLISSFVSKQKEKKNQTVRNYCWLSPIVFNRKEKLIISFVSNGAMNWKRNRKMAVHWEGDEFDNWIICKGNIWNNNLSLSE